MKEYTGLRPVRRGILRIDKKIEVVDGKRTVVIILIIYLYRRGGDSFTGL